MPRIHVNSFCNLLTGIDSDSRTEPQITLPLWRKRLYLHEAEQMVKDLQEALERAKTETGRGEPE